MWGSKPTNRPTNQPTNQPTYRHCLTCRRYTPGLPTQTKPPVVFFSGANPMRFFSDGGGSPRGGVGQGSASRLTDQHPDKNHHEIRLYASYRAENWSIHIKTITCNVWNQSKPFKIASNMSFDTKNTTKSSKISKRS